MIVAIMQPTYLPWMGYFDLIDQSDVFMFLDTVAFSRQSWQQRNRILTGQGVQWLTVPTHHVEGAPICDIAIDNARPWRRKHRLAIEQSYRKKPYWSELAPSLDQIYSREWESLAELNIALIRACSEILGVGAQFERTSSLPPSAERGEGALVELCGRFGATTYLSPPGSFSYLRSDATFAEHGIRLAFQHFEHPTYSQGGQDFVPYLSVVDVLVNTGSRAAAVMRRGRRPPLSVREMPEP
jgi:hypothetical protein